MPSTEIIRELCSKVAASEAAEQDRAIEDLQRAIRTFITTNAPPKQNGGKLSQKAA